MTEFVLDSSAVLAVLQGEAGAKIAEASFDQSVISAANYAEVIAKLIQNGASPDDAEVRVGEITLEVASIDEFRAISAGQFHARTQGYGVSLGDRFCLALAEELAVPVLTGDRRWKELELAVEVILIR